MLFTYSPVPIPVPIPNVIYLFSCSYPSTPFLMVFTYSPVSILVCLFLMVFTYFPVPILVHLFLMLFTYSPVPFPISTPIPNGIYLFSCSVSQYTYS